MSTAQMDFPSQMFVRNFRFHAARIAIEILIFEFCVKMGWTTNPRDVTYYIYIIPIVELVAASFSRLGPKLVHQGPLKF